VNTVKNLILNVITDFRLVFSRNIQVRYFILLILCSLQSQLLHTQNIYDYEHSKKYSQYLFDSKQYGLASEELERVLFYNKDNDSVKFQLIRAYLLGNEFTIAKKRMDSLFPDQHAMPRIYALEYSKALLSLNSIYQAQNFINGSNTLTEKDKLYLNLNSELLDYSWDRAQVTFGVAKGKNVPLDIRYSAIFTDINTTRYKSPGLALALSAVVPGMGKVYTNNWKDGLFSFIFVGGTTFQAIRGYHIYGKNSAFFIAYTSLAATFYLGNLYGSFKSANKFNERLRKQIHSKIRSVFNDTL
jgi:hypothetical protein